MTLTSAPALPYWSVTVATSELPKAVLTVAFWPGTGGDGDAGGVAGGIGQTEAAGVLTPVAEAVTGRRRQSCWR